MVNLEMLDLTLCGVNSISSLNNMTKMKELYLDSNSIEDISPVSQMADLTILKLLGNRTEDLSPLSKLTNLTTLDLERNKVKDVSPLANLNNLQSLSLDDNCIYDLSPLLGKSYSSKFTAVNQKVTLDELTIKINEKVSLENPVRDINNNIIIPSKIYNSGKYNTSTNTITWPEQNFNKSLSYSFTGNNNFNGQIYLPLKILNSNPTITGATDKVITVGDTFDAREGVTAYDNEDGDLTDKIVITGSIDTTKPGNQTLIYKITDSDDNFASIYRNIYVNAIPEIKASNTSIELGSVFDPLLNVSAYDPAYGGITSRIKVIENNVNTGKIGKYKVVYQVEDIHGAKATKEIFVTVELVGNKDWENHFGKREIKYAMENGWVNSSNTFRPNNAITRAEFIKIVNKAFSFKTKSPNEPFKDVESNDWWYSEVLIAIGNGYITTANENFRPKDPITRQEVANIITTITKTKDNNLDKLNTYLDKDLVYDSMKSSVEGAIENGFMGVGSNIFNPIKNITRGEAIVTLYRVVN